MNRYQHFKNYWDKYKGNYFQIINLNPLMKKIKSIENLEDINNALSQLNDDYLKVFLEYIQIRKEKLDGDVVTLISDLKDDVQEIVKRYAALKHIPESELQNKSQFKYSVEVVKSLDKIRELKPTELKFLKLGLSNYQKLAFIIIFGKNPDEKTIEIAQNLQRIDLDTIQNSTNKLKASAQKSQYSKELKKFFFIRESKKTSVNAKNPQIPTQGIAGKNVTEEKKSNFEKNQERFQFLCEFAEINKGSGNLDEYYDKVEGKTYISNQFVLSEINNFTDEILDHLGINLI